MPKSAFTLRRDVCSTVRDVLPARFASEQILFKTAKVSNLFDLRSFWRLSLYNRFSTVRFYGNAGFAVPNRFVVRSVAFSGVPSRFSILGRHENVANFALHYDASQYAFCFHKDWFGAIRYHPDPNTGFAFRFDSSWQYQWKQNNRFHVISDNVFAVRFGKIANRFDIWKAGENLFPIRFGAGIVEYEAMLPNRFDIITPILAGTPLHRQALVSPGWRILAKNIVTEEVYNLGFLTSEHNSLENVYLPDGDYEISVLTSSLFWKDATDFDVKLISIRPGEEISPLPTIYNLRSSISQGETTIYWSANRSEVSDCVFGVWYSSHSPVPIDGQPSETVWYSPEMTEYQTSFRQNAPCYVAVAAMRTGEDLPSRREYTEIGPVKELFLDWKSTPPRCPDDIVVLDSPLPIYDPEVFTLHQDEPSMTLWS